MNLGALAYDLGHGRNRRLARDARNIDTIVHILRSEPHPYTLSGGHEILHERLGRRGAVRRGRDLRGPACVRRRHFGLLGAGEVVEALEHGRWALAQVKVLRHDFAEDVDALVVLLGDIVHVIDALVDALHAGVQDPDGLGHHRDCGHDLAVRLAQLGRELRRPRVHLRVQHADGALHRFQLAIDRGPPPARPHGPHGEGARRNTSGEEQGGRGDAPNVPRAPGHALDADGRELVEFGGQLCQLHGVGGPVSRGQNEGHRGRDALGCRGHELLDDLAHDRALIQGHIIGSDAGAPGAGVSGDGSNGA
mmetsp:Transcript_6432/g.19086  ORF Transcript_6432/g.19086 Transcript_6432/m.19086 type:complete len:307 (+) Transcript_6432:163-1083(+)